MKLVIDTDIGTDVDDAFALAYAFKNSNSNANIKAITTTIGNTEIRAKIARKLEKILQVDIPIIVGKSGSREVAKKYWCGFEHLALTERELKEPLKRLPFPQYDKDSVLICIAPLTNIAYQLENNPSIKNVKRIYVMGSSFDDHNLKVDVEATKEVLAQPWTIYQITKRDSKKVCFTRNELEKFKNTEVGNFLYESAIRWLDYTLKEKLPMYDVLTVSSALGEKYVKFKKQNNNVFISCDVDLEIKNKILEAIR